MNFPGLIRARRAANLRLTAIGGEPQLDSRFWSGNPEFRTRLLDPTAHVMVLVDEHGKVLEAQSADPETVRIRFNGE